jgi:DNA repair exonuclease SbcCD ATPase subunit
MNHSIQGLEGMRKITNYGIPKTGKRITLPMDCALQELSSSLIMSESALGGNSWNETRTLSRTASAASVIHRPWTSPASETTRKGKRAARLRPTEEEKWLEGMLAQQGSGLEQEHVDRSELLRLGLQSAHITRLYRLLYLHSSSLQDVILWITEQCQVSARGGTLVRVWQLFVRVVEHLLASQASSQLSSTLQQSTSVINELQQTCEVAAGRSAQLANDLETAVVRGEELEREVKSLRRHLETSLQEGRVELLEEQTKRTKALAHAEAMLRKGDEYSVMAYERMSGERQTTDTLVAQLEEAIEARRAADAKLGQARQAVQAAESNCRRETATRAGLETELARTQRELTERTEELDADRSSVAELREQLEQAGADQQELQQRCVMLDSSLRPAVPRLSLCVHGTGRGR